MAILVDGCRTRLRGVRGVLVILVLILEAPFLYLGVRLDFLGV